MSSILPSAKTAPTAPTAPTADVAALVTMTKALLSQRSDAASEKGNAKARATQACKDQAAVILAAILQDPTLRCARVAVVVKSTLRGDEATSTVTVPCIDAVRAVAFGGPVVGSARLA